MTPTLPATSFFTVAERTVPVPALVGGQARSRIFPRQVEEAAPRPHPLGATGSVSPLLRSPPAEAGESDAGFK